MSYKDKQKQREAYRRWLEKNRKKHAEMCAEWRKNNKEKHAEYMRQYFLEHHEEESFKEMHRKSNSKYRAKKKAA